MSKKNKTALACADCVEKYGEELEGWKPCSDCRWVDNTAMDEAYNKFLEHNKTCPNRPKKCNDETPCEIWSKTPAW